ncbi:hypothetical protein ACOMHN_004026 [Nucella lapillus]
MHQQHWSTGASRDVSFEIPSFCTFAIPGYADIGAYWRASYETENFEQDVAALFKELQPLYQQLHAFVRRRLKKQYGEDVFPASWHIPAHLLGNMWGQSFQNIEDLLMPYPDKPLFDVTPHMLEQNYTVRKIYETAEDFFVSLGLDPMPQAFWNKSMIEKPKDGRQVVCYASAWDFRDGKDFRIKACTGISMNDMRTTHHEMGHIEYYISYKHLPVEFRRGANPGFHEAIGDTIVLSFKTPKHLHRIGLMPDLVEDNEADLNFLMYMALKQIGFLPFGYLVDMWRWSVFRGDTTPENYNQAWWDLRCNLQGMSPPVERTEDDFDPGAKFHIPNNTPYIRYFVRNVLMFQFQKALCEAAGHQGPLHTCDIYGSTAAGHKFRAMLSKGSSEVWTVPFQALTGQTKMSVQPLKEYFQPPMSYLLEVNKDDTVGWTEACPPPVSRAAAHATLTTSWVLTLGTFLVVFR